jgi:hypothetical protein
VLKRFVGRDLRKKETHERDTNLDERSIAKRQAGKKEIF